MLFSKTSEEIAQAIINRFVSIGIDYTGRDGIMSQMSRIIADEIKTVYDDIDRLYDLSFIDNAYGEYLDMIGERIGCFRRETTRVDEEGVETVETEDDTSYRRRIMQWPQIIAGGTKAAIERNIRDSFDVADIKFKEYTFGPASISIIVLLTDPIARLEDIAEMKRIATETAADGIQVLVRAPDLLLLDITILVETPDATIEERETVVSEIIDSIEELVTNLLIGEGVRISDINEIVIRQPLVTNFEITHIALNDEVLPLNRDIEIFDDQKIIPNAIEII